MRSYANVVYGCCSPNSNDGLSINIPMRERKSVHRRGIIGLHKTERVCCITADPDIRVAQRPGQQW